MRLPGSSACLLLISEAYVLPTRSEIHPWTRGQAAAANDKTIGVYLGGRGYRYNDDIMKAARALPATVRC